jgi:hypothetical protein
LLLVIYVHPPDDKRAKKAYDCNKHHSGNKEEASSFDLLFLSFLNLHGTYRLNYRLWLDNDNISLLSSGTI